MADSERDVLAEALRDAERGWGALVAASSRGRNITRDHYIADWLIRGGWRLSQAAQPSAEPGLEVAVREWLAAEDERSAQWRAAGECGHDDPMCPEMEAIRETGDASYDRQRAAIASMRAALSDRPTPGPVGEPPRRLLGGTSGTKPPPPPPPDKG